jgi:hypothetical protein
MIAVRTQWLEEEFRALLGPGGVTRLRKAIERAISPTRTSMS